MNDSFFYLLFLLTFCFSQYGQYGDYNASRFSRSIGLGNAYTGVAEGIETTFYNSAGLADVEEYIIAYSNGDGRVIDSDLTSHDFGIVLPSRRSKGSFSFTYNDFRKADPLWRQRLYRLHIGTAVTPTVSLGGSINYYRMDLYGETNGNGWDFSLSFLYNDSGIIRKKIDDRLKIGFQFQNVLGLNVKYNKGFVPQSLFQLFRVGMSYSLMPIINYTNKIRLMVAGDVSFQGKGYEFKSIRGNIGIEIELYRYFYLRCGSENELQSSDVFPSIGDVYRFGLGVRVPLHEIFNLEYFDIFLDYSDSHWPEKNVEYLGSIERQYYTYTIQIRANL